MRAMALLAVVVLLGATGLASANHFSTGVYDGVALQPAETPTTPSVPTTSSVWVRATSTNGCFEASGNLNQAASELQQAATADPLCGRLVYNQGTTFEFTSPVDQDYPLGIDGLELDGFITDASWSWLGWCQPFWCSETIGQAFQDSISAAGLGDDYNTYKQATGGGDYQVYGNHLAFPNAGQVVSDTTGLWAGDGWTSTSPTRSLVAFLTLDGEALDEDGLATLVESLKQSGDLPPTADPSVCAFTPDADIAITAGDDSFCEVTFAYIGEDESGDGDITSGDTTWDQYDHRCTSPSYICGTLTPAWYSNLIFLPRPTSSADQSSDSTTDYDVWHFVAAPASHQCTQADPGFDPAKDYLAHDLDVYEAATAPTGVDQVNQVAQTADTTADTTTDPYVDMVNNAASLDLAATSGYTIQKDRTLEPNAAGDTSQSEGNNPDLQRTLGSAACDVLNANAEQFADPWVDYIDNRVWEDMVAVGLSPLHLTAQSTPDQDASNTAGPGLFYMNGFVGMFTDKNDDGDYDRASYNSVFEDVDTVGAYPLLYDMFVKKEAGQWVPDTNAGCKPGFSSTPWTKTMAEAGYGPATGIVQVLHLSEPTVLYNYDEIEVLPFLDGGKTFVFMNQALTALYRDGDARAVNAVDDALAKVDPALDHNSPGVEFPAAIIGIDNDFNNQCSEATGGYDTEWEFLHYCQLGCQNDVIVTSYVLEPARSSGILGGGVVPVFDTEAQPNGFDFTSLDSDGDGLVQLFDVDPLTGDPGDNTGRGQAPPTS